ncbi:MAG: hypothetical protein ACTSWX_04545 [Promethearchaeota archaeon]
MPQKKKKLSLEEARALFSDKSEQPKKKRKYSNKKSFKPYQNSYLLNKEKIQKRIEQLERKIMEGNLEDEEEQKILNEIDKLEKKIQ